MVGCVLSQLKPSKLQGFYPIRSHDGPILQHNSVFGSPSPVVALILSDKGEYILVDEGILYRAVVQAFLVSVHLCQSSVCGEGAVVNTRLSLKHNIQHPSEPKT